MTHPPDKVGELLTTSRRLLLRLNGDLAWLKANNEKIIKRHHYSHIRERFEAILDRLGLPPDTQSGELRKAILDLIAELNRQKTSRLAALLLDGAPSNLS